MADVFERVAQSYGSAWRQTIADEIKEYITETVVSEATAAAERAVAPVPDPDTPGSYLIGG